MANPILEVVLKAKNEMSDTLNQVKGETNSLGESFEKNRVKVGMALAGAGAAVTAFGVLSVNQFASVGSALYDMSLKTGFSVETLSELKYAAEQSSGSIETVVVGARNLARNIYEAGQGSKEAADLFNELGLSLEDIKDLKPEDQFLAVAKRIAELESPTDRAAIAMKVFGRSGTELLPMLAEGAEGLDAMRKRAHELGITFTEDSAKQADKFGDSLGDLKASFQGVMLQIGSALSGVLGPFVEKVTDIIAKIRAWMDEHPGLAKVITVVVAALGALAAIVGSIILALPMITGMIATLGTVITVATGPVGLIAIAIAGLTAGIIYLATHWDQGWNGIKETAGKVWNFISGLF